jgi:beta-aspartyl-dipeptidase (metallo-type)
MDGAALARAGLEVETLDARGCWVVPGLIDPHAHLLGAGGEKGPATRVGEVTLDEVVSAGVTTVVGLLGSDASTRTPKALLGKVRELDAHGLTALMYTGAMALPPVTITGSVTDDLVFIEPVIGVAEVAIADHRSTCPTVEELARLCGAAHLGGLTGGKAGVVHFHLGDGRDGLTPLMELLDRTDLPPEMIYPTHITRNERVLRQSVDLAKRGCFVDTDVIENGTSDLIAQWVDMGGPLDRLTCSSDAHTPGGVFDNLLACLRTLARRWGGGQARGLARALPLFSSNVARALQLPRKGRLAAGGDADVLVLRQESLEVAHVIARGRLMVRNGQVELR